MPLSNSEGRILYPADSRNTVVFTVDVEDYFMSPECIPFQDWDSYSSAIHLGMERCLNLLDEYGAHGTFFFIGWLAERYPEIVEWTVEKGHEIATHTYNHTYVHQLDEQAFASSIDRSLAILRSLASSQAVTGHRAPAFSLDRNKEWQFKILRDRGILYDSSINPQQNYLYGDRTAPRHPYTLHGLTEIPPSVVEWFGRRFPVGGGGTLRILPECYLTRARVRYQSEGHPPVIYVHPWEFVPEHPRIRLPFKLHLIHWTGIRSMERKVRSILETNRVITMQDYYQRLTRQTQF